MTHIDISKEIVFTAFYVVTLAHRSLKNQIPVLLFSDDLPHTHCLTKPIDIELYPQALYFFV